MDYITVCIGKNLVNVEKRKKNTFDFYISTDTYLFFVKTINALIIESLKKILFLIKIVLY